MKYPQTLDKQGKGELTEPWYARNNHMSCNQLSEEFCWACVASHVCLACTDGSFDIFSIRFRVVANSEGEMANGSRVCNRSCNVCWSDGNG